MLILTLILPAACRKKRSDKGATEEHVAPTIPEPDIEMSDVDLYGDPLPEHALARLGSIRMLDRSIENMVFHPSGEAILANTTGGYAVWGVTSGVIERELPADNPGSVIAVSPSGKLLATGDRGSGSVLLWDYAAGTLTHTLKGHKREVTGACFVDEETLLTVSMAGSLRIWELSKNTSDAVDFSASPLSDIVCHASGVAVMGNDDGEVFVWRKGEKPVALGAGAGRVFRVAIAPSGDAAAAAMEDQRVLVWNKLEPGEPVEFDAHDRLSISLVFSGDGKKLITTGGDNWIRSWNPKTGRLIEEIPGIDGLDAQHMTMSPDGSIMATWSWHAGERGSEAGRFWLWNAEEGTLLLEPERHSRPLTAVAFSPDGSVVATASEDRTIRLWAPATGKQSAVWDAAQGAVNDLHWSRDGIRLYNAGADALISVWNTKTDDEARPVKAVGGAINSFSLNSDETVAVTGDQIGRAWTWDLAAGAKIQAFDRGSYSAVYAVALAPDGATLAVAGADAAVRVIDTKTGQDLAALKPDGTAANYTVAFSPDGKRLATGGDDHHVHIWSTEGWKLDKSLPGHDGTVRSLAFSGDGSRLISGGNDEIVRVWDLASGEEIIALEGHREVITGVALHKSGELAASASRDHTALIWRVP